MKNEFLVRQIKFHEIIFDFVINRSFVYRLFNPL